MKSYIPLLNIVISIAILCVPMFRSSSMQHSINEGLYSTVQHQNLLQIKASIGIYLLLFLPCITYIFTQIHKLNLSYLNKIMIIVFLLLLVFGMIKVALLFFSKSWNTILWSAYLLIAYFAITASISIFYFYKLYR